jgi:hypothetical protein
VPPLGAWCISSGIWKKVSSKMFFNFVMSASNVMKFLAYTSDEFEKLKDVKIFKLHFYS